MAAKVLGESHASHQGRFAQHRATDPIAMMLRSLTLLLLYVCAACGFQSLLVRTPRTTASCIQPLRCTPRYDAFESDPVLKAKVAHALQAIRTASTSEIVSQLKQYGVSTRSVSDRDTLEELLARQQVYMELSNPDPAAEQRKRSLEFADLMEKLDSLTIEEIEAELKNRNIRYTRTADRTKLIQTLALHIIKTGKEVQINTDNQQSVTSQVIKSGMNAINSVGASRPSTAARWTQSDQPTSSAPVVDTTIKSIDATEGYITDASKLQEYVQALQALGSFDKIVQWGERIGKQAVLDLLRHRKETVTTEDARFASLSSLASRLADIVMRERQQHARVRESSPSGTWAHRTIGANNQDRTPRIRYKPQQSQPSILQTFGFERELLRSLRGQTVSALIDGALVAQDLVLGTARKALSTVWQPLPPLRRSRLLNHMALRGTVGVISALAALAQRVVLQAARWAGADLIPPGQVLLCTAGYVVVARKGIAGWLAALGVIKVASSLLGPPQEVASTTEASHRKP